MSFRKLPSVGPPTAAEAALLGTGVQRTLRRLSQSRPGQRNSVRILFYGQSITEQTWSKLVEGDLRKRFPDANLEIENRAIGGFASQLLIRPAEHDLYPFYPDLVIFHVYGSDKEYEEIIRKIRSTTTAEVLMQRDHVTAWPPEKPDPNVDKGAWWDSRMNNETLPRIARENGCGLCDIRGPWLRYLKENRLEPKALLKDDVHLNDDGCVLMASLVSRHLVYRPSLPAPADTTIRDEKPRFTNGRLELTFDGNRIDAIGDFGGGSASVLLDGKPASASNLTRITRPQPNPWSPLALVRVDFETPPIPETWTLTITDRSADRKTFRYKVEGSVTGLDGDGVSDAPFRSRSGRVKIAPESFFRSFQTSNEIPLGYKVTWRVLPTSLDSYRNAAASIPGAEVLTTLAQGMTNARHTLTLVADDPKNTPKLRGLRVYRPSGK